MSYRHIKLKLINNDAHFAVYKILCADFNTNLTLENLGSIKLNKKEHTFTHEDNSLWLKNKIYPIALFDLCKNDREQIIKEKYSDYGSGMWAISVLNFTKKCFSENHFPIEEEFTG